MNYIILNELKIKIQIILIKQNSKWIRNNILKIEFLIKNTNSFQKKRKKWIPNFFSYKTYR